MKTSNRTEYTRKYVHGVAEGEAFKRSSRSLARAWNIYTRKKHKNVTVKSLTNYYISLHTFKEHRMTSHAVHKLPWYIVGGTTSGRKVPYNSHQHTNSHHEFHYIKQYFNLWTVLKVANIKRAKQSRMSINFYQSINIKQLSLNPPEPQNR